MAVVVAQSVFVYYQVNSMNSLNLTVAPIVTHFTVSPMWYYHITYSGYSKHELFWTLSYHMISLFLYHNLHMEQYKVMYKFLKF